jgi:hypothetical protein
MVARAVKLTEKHCYRVSEKSIVKMMELVNSKEVS